MCHNGKKNSEWVEEELSQNVSQSYCANPPRNLAVQLVVSTYSTYRGD
jgi:hypothetical protein